MRSKEVKNAIEILKQTAHEDDFTWFVYALGNVTGDSIDNATETVLSYIYELEKDSLHWRGKYHLLTREINVIPKEEIRAKIEEIEENPNNPYQKVMASQIDASLISCLKGLLGE